MEHPLYRNKRMEVTNLGDADRSAIYDAMMTMSGPSHTFEIARDAGVTARDGLDTTLSPQAVEHLHWLMSCWVGTRLVRTWSRDQIGPQKITVTVSVEVDGVPRIVVPQDQR
jgi:hypothetical protein